MSKAPCFLLNAILSPSLFLSLSDMLSITRSFYNFIHSERAQLSRFYSFSLSLIVTLSRWPIFCFFSVSYPTFAQQRLVSTHLGAQRALNN